MLVSSKPYRTTALRVHSGIGALAAALVIGCGGDMPSEDVYLTGFPETCTPDSCEIVLSHVATISDAFKPGIFPQGELRLVDRDGQGRLFMSSHDGFVVFDSLGQLITEVGGRGSGPGEFQLPLPPLIGPGDSVHVFDLHLGRVSVFDSHLGLARTATVRDRADLVREDGSYITAAQVRTPEAFGFPVHLVTPDGSIVRSFGADTPQYRPGLRHLMTRKVGPGPGSTIWSAAPGRYVLYQWDPDSGTRLKRIEVASTWFEEVDRWPRSTEPPPPVIQGIWGDDDGLIWVFLLTPGPDWYPIGHRPVDDAERAIRHDGVLEVIHPGRGTVIASGRFPELIWANSASRLLTSPRTEANDLSIEAFDVWEAYIQPKEETQ